MPYTLGCCFFGPPVGDLGKGVVQGTRRLYNLPSASQFSGWSPAMVHPAVWVGLAALLGVSILLYRRRGTALHGLLIRADGTEQVYKPGKKKFTLEELQKAVGGYIEQVPVALAGRKKMWVDEEGLLKHRPVNVKATKIAMENGYPAEVTGPLVGDVLITEPGEGI